MLRLPSSLLMRGGGGQARGVVSLARTTAVGSGRLLSASSVSGAVPAAARSGGGLQGVAVAAALSPLAMRAGLVRLRAVMMLSRRAVISGASGDGDEPQPSRPAPPSGSRASPATSQDSMDTTNAVPQVDGEEVTREEADALASRVGLRPNEPLGEIEDLDSMVLMDGISAEAAAAAAAAAAEAEIGGGAGRAGLVGVRDNGELPVSAAGLIPKRRKKGGWHDPSELPPVLVRRPGEELPAAWDPKLVQDSKALVINPEDPHNEECTGGRCGTCGSELA